MTTDREKWDAKYASCPPPRMLAPDDWLIDQVAELAPGRVLELACGLGHNAVWLAQQGWQVDAVDVSPIGLAIAVQLARRANTHVNWIAADLDDVTTLPTGRGSVTFKPDGTCFRLLLFKFGWYIDSRTIVHLIGSLAFEGSMRDLTVIGGHIEDDQVTNGCGRFQWMEEEPLMFHRAPQSLDE